MKKIFTIILLTLSVALAKAQQDAQLSQYMFNGIYINPAYAGYKEQLNIQAFYRNQWTEMPGAPKTMSIAIDAIANNGNVGLALQVSNDRIAAESNLAAYANYAYRLALNGDRSSRLAFGLGIGVVQPSIDGAMLKPNDIEANQPLGVQRTFIPDARAGVYYSTNRFYAGFSADNLVSQFINIDRYIIIPKPRAHYYLTAGALVPLNKDVQLKPSFLLKDDRGGPTSLDLSAFLILGDKFWIGGSYRKAVKLYNKSYLQKDLSNLNSVVGAVQFFAGNNLRIGYACDFSTGALQGYGGSTHEISVGFLLNNKNIRINNPRLF